MINTKTEKQTNNGKHDRLLGGDKQQLYGYIVWNAHNTVFGSKCPAICAQAVYFLHSTRPSVA